MDEVPPFPKNGAGELPDELRHVDARRGAHVVGRCGTQTDPHASQKSACHHCFPPRCLTMSSTVRIATLA